MTAESFTKAWSYVANAKNAQKCSSFFSAIAGHSRVVADAIGVFGAGARSETSRSRWISVLCVALPLLSLAIFVAIPAPVTLVLVGGVMQGIMLPMLAGAALYFRYRRSDRRIAPGRLWDLMLWLSALGLLVAGIATVLSLLAS